MLQPIRRKDDPYQNTGPKADELLWLLTDSQWTLIADLFPDPPMTRKEGRPFKSNWACFEGIL